MLKESVMMLKTLLICSITRFISFFGYNRLLKIGAHIIAKYREGFSI